VGHLAIKQMQRIYTSSLYPSKPTSLIIDFTIRVSKMRGAAE
jgi:hypothetical protein